MGKELAPLAFWALQASSLTSDASGVHPHSLNVIAGFIAACFCFHLLSPPFTPSRLLSNTLYREITK